MENEQIAFYNMPNEINVAPYEITCDGDKDGKRLHIDPSIRWYEDDEQLYNKIEQEIDNYSIKGSGWELYAWCDSSGYDYWINGMEEPNYIQLSIAFDSKYINKDELDDIVNAIDKATYWAEQYESYNW